MTGLLSTIVNVSTGGQRVASSFSFRAQIDIINTGNPEGLEGDQINIVLNSSNFDFSHAMSNGEDIRFKSLDGSVTFNHWIESYSSVAQTASIWVKVSGITAAATGSIYMYYGKAGSTSGSSQDDTMTFPEVGTDNCTHLFEGVNTYSGVLDTYPEEGAIKAHFNTTSDMGNNRVFTKYNSASDSIDCYIHNTTNKLIVVVTVGGVLHNLTSTTTILANTEYCVVFVWNSLRQLLYLNGEVEARADSKSMPANGGGAVFSSGKLVSTSGANDSTTFSGTISEGAIYNSFKTRPEAVALAERRNFYGKDEESKWNTLPDYYIDDPAGDSVSYAEEPSLLFVDGTYWLYYTKQATAIWRSTSTDLINWTTPVKNLGGGSGGEASPVTMRSIIFKDGSTYYIGYQRSGSGGGPLILAESTDGINWTNHTVVLPVAAFANNNGWHNHAYVKLANGDWVLLAEGENAVTYSPYRYFTAVFKSTTGIYGPYSEVGTNPKTSIQYQSNYLYSGPFATLINNVIHEWTHQGTLSPLVNEIYRVYSEDGGNTWQKPYAGPIDRMDRNVEVDQVADPYICDTGTSLVKASAMLHNVVPFTAYVGFATFNGTFEQIIDDLSITVGAEEVL